MRVTASVVDPSAVSAAAMACRIRGTSSGWINPTSKIDRPTTSADGSPSPSVALALQKVKRPSASSVEIMSLERSMSARKRSSLRRSARSASTRAVASRETPTASTGRPSASRRRLVVISTCFTVPSRQGWSKMPTCEAGVPGGPMRAMSSITPVSDSGVRLSQSGSSSASSTESPRRRVTDGLT